MVSLLAALGTAFLRNAFKQMLKPIIATCNLYGHAAVRFVLNDVFSGLRADDRQKLLHVSCNQPNTPASVHGNRRVFLLKLSSLSAEMLAGRRWACCAVSICRDRV